MKKLISLVMAFTLVLSAACIANAADDYGSAAISAVVERADNPGEINASFYLSENTRGVWSVGFRVDFNNESVELIGVDGNGGIFASGSEWLEPEDTEIANANSRGDYVYSAQLNSISSNLTSTGLLCTLKFRLKSSGAGAERLTFTATGLDGYNLHVVESERRVVEIPFEGCEGEIVPNGSFAFTATPVYDIMTGNVGVRYDIAENTDGIYSFGFYVDYDNTKVELVRCDHNSGLFDDYYEWTAEDYQSANKNGSFYYTAWNNSVSSQVEATSGNVGTLWFKLREGVDRDEPLVFTARPRAGSYNLRVTDFEGDIPETVELLAEIGSVSFTYSELSGADRLPGDIDLNGKVELADVRFAIRCIAENTTSSLSEKALANGDMDGDGHLSLSDVRAIIVKIANG